MEVRAEMLGVARDAKVSVNVVRALIDTAEREGLPRVQLLAAGHIDPRHLVAPEGRVRRADLYNLCDAALEISADSAMGLRWGERLPDQSLNVVSHLVTYAPTLRQAFQAISRFSKLLTEEPGFCVVERDDTVAVRCLKPRGASLRVERFLAEMTMAGLYRLIRSYSPFARARRVTFEYPAPTYRTDYARVFDTAALFDHPHTSIVFDRAVLNSVSPRKDEDLHSALRALAERRLMRVTARTPYSVRVREILMRQGAPSRVSMDQAARELDISVRSLRRRLSDEGKSFGEVTNDASKALAMRLIADERRTIQETAYAMGFANVNSFHRAFKRWTGTTPCDFRNREWVGSASTPSAG